MLEYASAFPQFILFSFWAFSLAVPNTFFHHIFPIQYTYIFHHVNTYGNVPFWAAMNLFKLINKVIKQCPHLTREQLPKNGLPGELGKNYAL